MKQCYYTVQIEKEALEAYWLRHRLKYLDEMEAASYVPPDEKEGMLEKLLYEYSDVSSREKLLEILRELDQP